MSDQNPYDPYGQQPNPYGQQSGQPNPYGQPPAASPQNPYAAGGGQDPYGQVPPGAAPYGQYGQAVPPGGYASWGQRVLAVIVDGLFGLIPGAIFLAGYIWLLVSLDPYTDSAGETHFRGDGNPLAVLLIIVGAIAGFAFTLWNIGYRQGKTGQSLGKKVVGISILSVETGRPIGFGMSVVRQIAHIADNICMIGYLWPLWDDRNQTFADKMLNTVSVRV